MLLDLMTGLDGRRFRALANNDSDNGWSKIVDDLISQTATRRFTRKGAKARKVIRGTEGIAALKSSNFSDHLIFASDSGRSPLNLFRGDVKDAWVDLKKDAVNNVNGGDTPPNLPVEPIGDVPRGDGGCSMVVIDLSAD